MMTEQEKQAVETLTRSFTRMETLYKVKCMEVEAREEEISRLKAENAALREKIEKALELPRIERLFNGKVGSYKVVYQDKNNRITSEYYSDEKREAAEARLKELKENKQ